MMEGGEGGAGGNSIENQTITILEMEKKTLEQMRRQQQSEIQKMIEFEIKQEMQRRRNEEKEVKKQQRNAESRS